MTQRVLRFPIPVDDEWHEFQFSGSVAHVQCRDGEADQVQLWALDYSTDEKATRKFRVFGTGHPVPTDADYRGTAVARGGALVWHVFEDYS